MDGAELEKDVLVEREIDGKNIEGRDIVDGIAQYFDTCDSCAKGYIIKNFTELSKDIPIQFKDVVWKALKI